ncbi:bifunctional oligoribonuclease/PAP phosphatase NrnA [Candidatus Parcubacteria bacterium]|nr:bifunctional oligoribonuclease/PAP phosphatase NrnA [Candidatus Parcubacteria bacterium]
MLDNKHKEALKKIKAANNILLVTHYRPDGDALASICAMGDVLDSFGKKFTAFCKDQPPTPYSFLPGVEKITSDKGKLNFFSFDLIIALDCGELSRTALVDEISTRNSKQIFIEFDHHPRVDDYSDLEIRTTEISSTSELLYDFCKANKIKISKNIATCVLTGILTDTGNLMYDSTSDKTIKVASDMLVYGARFPTILDNTQRNKSIGGLKIWGIAMHRLSINKKYNIAFTVLTRKDFIKTKASDEEMEGVPGYLSNLAETDAILFLRETEDGKIKGSLRSTSDKVDVSALAKKLGGGGHTKASAFMLDAKLVKDGERYYVK